MSNKDYKLMDLLKFIFSICVVCIHTYIADNFNNNIQWYIYSIIFMSTIPFFFMVSGFFFGKSVHNSREDIYLIRNKRIKRLLIPYIFWLLLNSPYKLLMTYRSKKVLKTVILEIFKSFVFYPWGALWYITATIVSIIILSYFIKKKKIKIALVISIILFVFCLLGDTYRFLLHGKAKDILDTYLNICISSRNGLFAGFPLFTIGYYISTKENRIEKCNIYKCILILVIIILFQVYEVSKIRFLSPHYSFFISTIPVVSCITVLCVKLKNINIGFNTRILRNYSTGIYFMHIFIRDCVTTVFSILDITKTPLYLFLSTLSIMLVMLTVLYKINNKYINLVIK